MGLQKSRDVGQILLPFTAPPSRIEGRGTVLISIHTTANRGACAGLSLRATKQAEALSPELVEGATPCPCNDQSSVLFK
jgi:hypothetical protein